MSFTSTANQVFSREPIGFSTMLCLQQKGQWRSYLPDSLHTVKTRRRNGQRMLGLSKKKIDEPFVRRELQP
jgi:hypothetical protein